MRTQMVGRGSMWKRIARVWKMVMARLKPTVSRTSPSETAAAGNRYTGRQSCSMDQAWTNSADSMRRVTGTLSAVAVALRL